MKRCPRLLATQAHEAPWRHYYARARRCIVCILLIALCQGGVFLFTPTDAHAVPGIHTSLLAEREAIAFAVVAGMPQTIRQAPRAQAVLRWIAHQPDINFIVHLGDLRTASDPCSDTLFASREAVLNATPAPLIFVPGENDWATCATAPGGGDPVERLDALRDSFFSGAMSLGDPGLRLIRQSELPAFRPYRENTRWIAHGVVFVTLNVPSGNNHFSDAGGRNGEYEDREVANRDWIARALTDARRRRAKALVFFFQADPVVNAAARRTRSGFASWFGARRERDGYAALRRDLHAAAETFSGPVLVVHTTPVNTLAGEGPLVAQTSQSVVYAEPMFFSSRNGKPLHNLLHLQIETPSLDHAWLKIVLRTRRGADTPSFHAVLETTPAQLPLQLPPHSTSTVAPLANTSNNEEEAPNSDRTSVVSNDVTSAGPAARKSRQGSEGAYANSGLTNPGQTPETASTAVATGATAGATSNVAPPTDDPSAIPPFPTDGLRRTQDITGAPVYDDGNDGWAGLPEEPHTLADPGSVLGDIARPILLPLPPQNTSPLNPPAR